jgi:hypothetical protein
MKRYTVFILAVLGSAATAIAAIAPVPDGFEQPSTNVTIIEKNQAFPLIGPLVVEDCIIEDCSEAAG